MSWLNAVAAAIMDGGSSPPSIERLNILIPPDIVTAQNDGHVTAAAAFGEKSRDDYHAGWRVIIGEMVTLLREQGFVGGSDAGLTWLKPIDGIWKVSTPDGRRFDVHGQRERRMVRDRSVIGERDEVTGERVGPPSLFEAGLTSSGHSRMKPLELLVESPRGKITTEKFEIHPLASLMPSYTESEREGLRADILRNGVKVPLVIYEKKILDGRNRGYFASVLNKPVKIFEFTGTEEEARRYVISLNIHRRHLNRLQLAILCEEIYGQRANEIAAEALRQGRIKGNQNRSPSRPISVSTGGPEQKVKRNEIVADLAKQDGINVTRYAIEGIQPIMSAPNTLAEIKDGKFSKTRDAVTAALKEKGQPIPNILPEMTPRSVNERLGICIDNLNRILIDCDMRVGSDAKPELISERINEVRRLNNEVEQALRFRRVI
jgi:hypothetical protein